jgi:hypothetical protein
MPPASPSMKSTAGATQQMIPVRPAAEATLRTHFQTLGSWALVSDIVRDPTAPTYRIFRPPLPYPFPFPFGIEPRSTTEGEHGARIRFTRSSAERHGGTNGTPEPPAPASLP